MRTDNIVRFTYIRDRRRNPIGGVAFQIVDDGFGNPTLRVGAAFCSKLDNFNKAEARRFANERLASAPLVKLVDQNDTLTKIMYDALTIATTELNNPDVSVSSSFIAIPSWVGASHRAKTAVRRMCRDRGI